MIRPLSPKDDFATHSLENAVFGENPSESDLPITILPPVPTDFHSPMQHPIPSKQPSTSDIPSTSTATPISLRDIASILLQHGLCVMAIPSLPPPKLKKPYTANTERNKLQRELQNLQSSICYDKSLALANREGPNVAK